METDEDEGGKTVDVLRYPEPDGDVYRTVPAGAGIRVVAANRRESSRRRKLRTVSFGVATLAVALGASLFLNALAGVLCAAVVAAGGCLQEYLREDRVTELTDETMLREDARETYDIDEHVPEPFVGE